MRSRKCSFTLAGVALSLLLIYLILLGIARRDARFQFDAVWNISAADIMIISISNRGELLRFENPAERGWILSSPSDIPYDYAVLQALPLTLANLTAEKRISVGNGLQTEYGFNDPIVIRILMKDGAEHKLLLGDTSITGDVRYFSTDGETIYAMDAFKAGALALDSLNVRDKNVLGLNRTLRPTDLAKRITDIRLNGESCPELAAALARLMADAFLSTSDSMEYGLSDPRYVIEFNVDNGAKVLFFGDTSEDGEFFYARTSDSDIVFTVSTRGFIPLIGRAR